MAMIPQNSYRGPIEYMEPRYGTPYSVKEYCPRCGSTRVEKVGEETDEFGHRIHRYVCLDCGLVFRLPAFRHINIEEGLKTNRGRRFRVSERLYDDGEEYPYEELEDGIFQAAMDDDPQYHEVTGQYYGSYYYGDDDDDFDGEWASELESDIPWVEAHNFVRRGYPDHMKVGDSYKVPDFDVKVTRTKNAKGKGKGKAPAKKTKKKIVKRS